MGDEGVVLYRLKPGHSLPSLSLGCCYLENYITLCGIEVVIQDCCWYSESPSGTLPCIDWKGELVCSNRQKFHLVDDLEEAEFIIKWLRDKGHDLQDHMSASEKALDNSFVSMIRSNLVPALLSSLWLERKTYDSFTVKSYGHGLSFPLNWILPMGEMFSMRRDARYAHVKYEEACSALQALADYFRSYDESNLYLLGDIPGTLDALVCACLAYIRCLPVHDMIRHCMKENVVLERILDGILVERMGLKIFSPSLADKMWEGKRASKVGDGGKQEEKEERKSAAVVDMETKGRYWLVGVGGLILGFVLLSGQYFEVQFVDEDIDADNLE